MNTHYGEIIFEDNELWVVRKRGGVSVEENSARRDLYTELKADRVQKGEAPDVFLIHRLDKNVEGLIVFAKSKEAAAALSGQFKEHTIRKEYLAVVQNAMNPPDGELINHVGKQGQVAFIEPAEREWTKEARLSYQTIARKEDTSLLRISLMTGRFHQIRVQLSHAGCPILGDQKYGKEDLSKRYPGPALCAYRLSFSHPRTKEALEFRVTPEGEAFQPFQEEIKNL